MPPSTRQAWLGIACYALWLLLFSSLHPGPFVDEKVHQAAISAIADGAFTAPDVPMLPGYHWLVAAATMMVTPSLAASRFTTFVVSAAALLVYCGIQPPGRSTPNPVLLAAFLPILFPYTSMVYTDAVGVFFLVGALQAHTAGRHVPAAIAGLAACFVRQSSAVWIGFLMAWSAWNVWDGIPRDASSTARIRMLSRGLLPRIAGHLVALAFLAAALTVRGGVLASQVPLNEPAFNVGNYYTLAFLVLLLWLPLWIADAPAAIRALRARMEQEPWRVIAGAVVIATLVVALTVTFSNWHPWNRYNAYLANIPLIAMDRYPVVRVLAVICVIAAVWLVTRRWSADPNRRLLASLAAVTLLFLSFHSSVDVRYAIVPFLLADFLQDYSRVEVRRLTAWYAVICTVVAAMILTNIAGW